MRPICAFSAAGKFFSTLESGGIDFLGVLRLHNVSPQRTGSVIRRAGLSSSLTDIVEIAYAAFTRGSPLFLGRSPLGT